MSKSADTTERLRRMLADAQSAAQAESRLSEIRRTESRISEPEIERDAREGVAPYGSGSAGLAVHPAQGERGAFLKVTVTMDPDDFEAINAEMVRRKRAKERGAQLSGCIREAIRFWRASGMPRQD